MGWRGFFFYYILDAFHDVTSKKHCASQLTHELLFMPYELGQILCKFRFPGTEQSKGDSELGVITTEEN